LIIAEKPSVAADIAARWAASTANPIIRKRRVVLSRRRPPARVARAGAVRVKRGKWSFAHLPVIPPHFDLRRSRNRTARLKQLEKLSSEGRGAPDQRL